MELIKRLDAPKSRRRGVTPNKMHGILTEAGFSRRMGKGDVSKAVRAIETVLDPER